MKLLVSDSPFSEEKIQQKMSQIVGATNKDDNHQPTSLTSTQVEACAVEPPQPRLSSPFTNAECLEAASQDGYRTANGLLSFIVMG